jgi:peptidoglycan-associated lipoprotein
MPLRFLMVGIAVLTLACGKKQPEAAPAPTTGETTPPPPPPPPPPPSNPTGRTGPDPAAETADLLRTMQETIYFDYDQDALKPEGQAALDRKAGIMLANSALRIRIAGHADERGSDEYNVVLSNRRATAAKRYLEAKGIDGSRIETIAYGEERPADTGGTEEAFARNRRDEFTVTAGGDRLVRSR